MQNLQSEKVKFHYKKLDVHINDKNISKELLEHEKFYENENLQDTIYATLELICNEEKYKFIRKANFLIPFYKRKEHEKKFLTLISIILDVSICDIENHIRKIRGYENK